MCWLEYHWEIVAGIQSLVFIIYHIWAWGGTLPDVQKAVFLILYKAQQCIVVKCKCVCVFKVCALGV